MFWLNEGFYRRQFGISNSFGKYFCCDRKWKALRSRTRKAISQRAQKYFANLLGRNGDMAYFQLLAMNGTKMMLWLIHLSHISFTLGKFETSKSACVGFIHAPSLALQRRWKLSGRPKEVQQREGPIGWESSWSTIKLMLKTLSLSRCLVGLQF